MFKRPDTNINLHMFSRDDEKIERMLRCSAKTSMDVELY